MCNNRRTTQVRLCKPNTYSKRTIVKVDKCIAPLIQMLNDYGVRTLGCCCGHYETLGSVFIENKTGTKFELFTGKIVKRKSRFYDDMKKGIPKPITRNDYVK